MRRLSSAAFVGLVVVLLTAPAASAGKGATVIKVSSCYAYSGMTLCSTLFLVTQERTTPSGNTTYQLRERTSHTITDDSGAAVYEDAGRDHIKTLTTDGGEQVELRSASHSVTVLGETCTDSFRYHLANGVPQYDEFVFSCS